VLAAGISDRQPTRLDSTRPGDLRKAAGRGDHVACEEHAVGPVDRGLVAPGLAGRVQGAGASVHDLAPAPRLALVEALSWSLPEAQVRGVAAGLFVLALLPDAVDEEALVSAAAARGVGVEGLSWHRLLAGGPPGLVLGFANLSRSAIDRGAAELGQALEMAV